MSQREAIRCRLKLSVVKRPASGKDSFERRADLLGHPPAGHVIDCDEQLKPPKAQVFESKPRDEPHCRGGDALPGLTSPHPVAYVCRLVASDPIKAHSTEDRCRADAADSEVIPGTCVPRLNCAFRRICPAVSAESAHPFRCKVPGRFGARCPHPGVDVSRRCRNGESSNGRQDDDVTSRVCW
jgi:hypothetical protein